MNLTPQEFDAIDTQAPSAPKPLSPQEFDQANQPLTPAQFDATEPATRPVNRQVRGQSTTAGGPPLSVPEGGDVGSQAGELLGDVFWNHPAIQLMPKITKQDLIESAREFASGSVSYPGMRYEFAKPKPEDVEKSKVAGLATGYVNSINDAVNWMTTPQGIYTSMVPALPAWASRLASGYFAYHMGKQVPQQAAELGAELGKPDAERDYEKIGKTGTDILTSSGLAAVAGAHAGRSGIANDVPMVRQFLTDSITKEYSPQEMKDLFRKVDSGQADEHEMDVYRFVNSELQSPGQAFRKGVRITTTTPKVGSDFWQKYLGLEKGSKTIELLGGDKGAPGATPAQPPTPGAPRALLPEEYDAIEAKGNMGSVPVKQAGAAPIGETGGQTGGSDSVPGDEGQRGQGSASPAAQPPQGQTPGIPGGGNGDTVPQGGNPVPEPAGKPIQPGAEPEPTIPSGPTPKPTPTPAGEQPVPAPEPKGLERFGSQFDPRLGNKLSTAVGLEISKPDDLDALAKIRNDAIALATQLKNVATAEPDPKRKMALLNDAMGIGMRAQLARESIEVATNSGSWAEGEGSTQKALGPRPLDWRKNPDTAKWLLKNGEKLGIDVTDVTENGKPPAPVNPDMTYSVKIRDLALEAAKPFISNPQSDDNHLATLERAAAQAHAKVITEIAQNDTKLTQAQRRYLNSWNKKDFAQSLLSYAKRKGIIKPLTSTLSDEDKTALTVIKGRMADAEGMGMSNLGGIKAAVKAYESGDPTELAKWPPVASTLQALNMEIDKHTRNQGAPIRDLINSALSGQHKAATLRKMADTQGLTVKQMQERVELEIVRMANEIASDESVPAHNRFTRLIDLYNRQPTLSARTSTSIENQAYSTPAPLAFALKYMTMTTPKTTVYDATAGNGMLLIGSNIQMGEANELNPERAKNLESLGVPVVTSKDATRYSPPGTFSVIHLNPPFGGIDTVGWHGYAIKKLEHLIAVRALDQLKPNGRAAIILGAKMEPGETKKGAQWVFENYLYGHFNVVANFEVSGDLYAKQGAKWPVRVIVIAGRKTPSSSTPQDLAPKSVARLDNWDQVWQESERARNAVESYRSSLVPGGQTGVPKPSTPEQPAADKPGAVTPPSGKAPAKTPVGGKPTGNSGTKQTTGPGAAPGSDQLPAEQPAGGSAGSGTPPAKSGSGSKPTTRVEEGDAASTDKPSNAGGSGAKTGPGSGPGELSKPGTVGPRKAGDLTGMSESELDDLLNQALTETKAETPPPVPAPKPKAAGEKTAPPPSIRPRTPRAPGPTAPPTAKGTIKTVTQEGIKGAGDALKGLDELFGKGGSLGTGPTFDEKTYEKAKPFFAEAWEHFKRAGGAIKDYFKYIFQRYGDKVLPYIKKFVQDLQGEQEKALTPPPPKPKATAFQDPYEPRSEGTPFGTVTPKNIAAGEHAALDALKARVGPIDAYLADKVNMTVDEIQRVLAAEQIDGSALAIDQIERGAAIIIGDETGIGKGRQAAMVIRYAILNGKIPLFFTKDPKLFTDMFGDLKDINTDVKPFLLGDPGKASIVDNQGNVLHRAPGKKVQDREIARILSDGLQGAGYNAIFATYSQINMRNNRQEFLEQLARREPTIIILDEAHEAAGDNETSMQAAFMSGGQVRRGSGAEATVTNLPGLLNMNGTKAAQGGGVVYLSATYAKRPENMPVYFRTDLSKAAQSFKQIVDAMKRGGVALQQSVSEALAKAGQYLRRERDFSGVRYDMKTVGVEHAADLINQVDQTTDVLSQIMQFSDRIRGAVSGSTAMSSGASDMTDFAAIVHNQVSQLLLAAKADAVVQEAIDAKARGEKPVIALMNTMESFLSQYVTDKNIQHGQEFQLRWNELLKYALERTLRRTEDLPNGDTVITMVNPDDFGLGDAYREIQEAAAQVESKFPVSPIDYIIQKLNAAGVTMVELTGRESGIQYTNFETGEGTYKRFPKANKNTVVNGFNNGVYDGMLLNASGSTGLSAHASLKTGKDHRPRAMIIAQPALDINVFVQTLGRIKRTGMLLLGKGEDGQPYGARYVHLVLPIQAEMRPAAMAARKMKSLNANTTAEADNAIKIDAEDLFNRYGDRVVAEYLDLHPEFQARLGLYVDLKDDGSVDVPRDVARRFTGRASLLPDAVQKSAYAEIIPNYKQLIEQLKATGEYDLEIVTHSDWDGIQKSDDQLAAGTDESNIFTAGVRLQKWEVRDTRHTPTGAEMVREFQTKTGGREQLLAEWGKVQERGDAKIEALQKRFEDEQAAWNEVEARKDTLSEKEKTAHELRQSEIARLGAQLAGAQRRWDLAKSMADHILPTAGRVIDLNNNETGDVFPGMMVDVKFPTTRFSASAFRFRFMLNTPGGIAYVNGAQFSPTGWQLDLSDKSIEELRPHAANARYDRFMVTGNPIRGYVATGGRGKMTRFVSQGGQVITGLLMPRNWGPAQLSRDPRMDLVNGRAATHFLTNYGMDGRTSIPIESAGVVRITRQGWGNRTYSVSTSNSRKTGRPIYLDTGLRRIVGDFTKTGSRMVATFDEGELQKAVDRIMAITKESFRPVGNANTLIPQVNESNQRGGRKAFGTAGPVKPVEQPRGPVTAGSVEELRAALSNPNSGLPREAVRLMTAFLDSPLGAMLEGVRYEISDALSNGWQGSYFQNLVEVARGADPVTGVHEMLHAIWDVMPDELKAEFERLRVAHITDLIEEAKKAGDEEKVQMLEHIRDNPTSTGEEFVARGYPFAMERDLASVASAEEFFAHSGSNRFKQRTGSLVEGFWDKIKAIIRGFIAAVRNALRRKQSLNSMLDKVLTGDFAPGVRSRVEAERAYAGRQASLPPKPEPAPGPEPEPAANDGMSAGDLELMDDETARALEEDGVKTQVFGHKDTVLDRERLTPAARAAGKAFAAATLAKAGLQVQEAPDGFYELVDPDFESEIEGRRLLNVLKEELGTQNEAGKDNGFLANLLRSVVLHMTTDDITAFSSELKAELYAVAQGEVSHRGILLAALRGFGKTITYVARHVDVTLKRIYSDNFGGDFVRKVINRIATSFRDYFTEEEISDALTSKPELADFLNKALALNRRDEGNAAYRKVQALLKPKRKKTLARLESDARTVEAFRAMVEEAKRQGVEPPANPNKPLTPIQQLIRMANPKQAAKVEAIVQEAVAQGMRNAGIKAALSGAADQNERADLEGRFAAGEEPSEDMIESGLNLPEYSHWRAIRDNWLGYNPVTIKLVQKLISSDFKGTRFETPQGKPIDTRINLESLAKAPEAEVQRVMDAFADKLDQALNLANASIETRQRVQATVEENLTRQIEQARQRVREPLFKAPSAKNAALTPEQRIGQLINAGLFGDQRLNLPEFVQRVASKSAIGRLTPKAADLVRQALQTPFYRQSEIAANFAKILADQLGLTQEQAARAREVFEQAFADKFKAAKERAAKASAEALTPQERQFQKARKPIWQKIVEAANAGNFDSGDVLREIAQAHGWSYSQAAVERLKELSAQLQRLSELSHVEQSTIGNNPEELAKALAEKQAVTKEKALAIKREMQTLWARLTKPLFKGKFPWIANRQNFAAAANEFEVANLLLKVGFPVRLATHITTQLAFHTPTRGIADGIERFLADRAAGREGRLWSDVYASTRDAYRDTLKAILPALQSARDALAGRAEVRNVDRLMSGVQALERAAMKAEELRAQGKTAQAFALTLVSWVRLSLRVTQALDNFQGTPAEAQELRALVVNSLRENGRTRAEAEVAADSILRVADDAIPTAVADAKAMWDAIGEDRTPAQLASDARNLVKARTYQALREVGLPVDDFEEKIRLLRSTIAWQERTTTGPGGVVATAGKAATAVMAHYGLPFSFARFSNAMGTGINYMLMFTPLYSVANARLPGAEPSPWFATERDRMQRRVQATLGSLIGAAMFALAAAGAVVIRMRWPESKEEREQLQASGHRLGTIEIPVSDHEFIPISMSVGPLSMFAPYFAAGGAVKDLVDRQAKIQAKLDAEAAKTGLPAGKARPIDSADLLGVAGAAAMASMMGGKTATGLAASMTEQGSFNSRKTAAAFLSPLVPGLPMYQEISRMMGVQMDSKLASIGDFMVPLPTSQARAVNMLGDPVGTPDAVQRVVQVFTAGTYPGVVDTKAIQSNPAYAALFDSGFRPPSIDPNKGYAINGEYRPFTNEELSQFTQIRGDLLKSGLAGLGAGADAKSAKQAFNQANQEALSRMGAGAPTSTASTSQSQAPAQGTGTTTGARSIPTARTRTATASPAGRSKTVAGFRSLRGGLRRSAGAPRTIRPRSAVPSLRRPGGLGVPRAPSRLTGARSGIPRVGSLRRR